MKYNGRKEKERLREENCGSLKGSVLAAQSENPEMRWNTGFLWEDDKNRLSRDNGFLGPKKAQIEKKIYG